MRAFQEEANSAAAEREQQFRADGVHLAAIERKIKRAVTDTETEVRFDPRAKPGVSNLLSILAACTGGEPEALAPGSQQSGKLKADTAAAVVEFLRPIQERYRELAGDPNETARLLAKGATKATELSGPVLKRAKEAIGLLPA